MPQSNAQVWVASNHTRHSLHLNRTAWKFHRQLTGANLVWQQDGKCGRGLAWNVTSCKVSVVICLKPLFMLRTLWTFYLWRGLLNVSSVRQEIKSIVLLTYLLTYLLTPSSTVLLEDPTGSQLVKKKFPRFLEPEGSSPHSQVPATCPYPELIRFRQHPHISLPEDPS